MRVCDRHRDRPSKERFKRIRDDSEFDLCDQCVEELTNQWLQVQSEPGPAPVKNKGGRPRKNGKS